MIGGIARAFSHNFNENIVLGVIFGIVLPQFLPLLAAIGGVLVFRRLSLSPYPYRFTTLGGAYAGGMAGFILGARGTQWVRQYLFGF